MSFQAWVSMYGQNKENRAYRGISHSKPHTFCMKTLAKAVQLRNKGKAGLLPSHPSPTVRTSSGRLSFNGFLVSVSILV